MRQPRRRPVTRRRYNLPGLIAGGFLLACIGLGVWVKWRSSRENVVPAGAVVVLGAAQWAGRPSPVLQARLDRGIELYKEGYASVLVLTGGSVPGDSSSEAAVGRDYALSQGVPSEDILIEEESRTTVQNLQGARSLLAPRQIDSILLVSDPFHMGRAVLIARDLGFDAHPAPTRSSPISQDVLKEARYIIREVFALITYWVLGK